jgi:hypothetical protein
VGGVTAVQLVVTPRTIRNKQGMVAILGFYPKHLTHHYIQRFIPADLCEFSIAAPTNPFEWVQESVGMVLAAQVSPAAGTSTQLWCSQRIWSIIGIQLNDPTVLYISSE